MLFVLQLELSSEVQNVHLLPADGRRNWK